MGLEFNMDPVKSIITDTKAKRITLSLSYCQAGQLSVLMADLAQHSQSENERRAVEKWLEILDNAIEHILEDELPESLMQDSFA